MPGGCRRCSGPGRSARLIAARHQYAPAARLTGLAAGFLAVAHLPPGAGEQTITTGARARLVGLYGMSMFRAAAVTAPPQLVLGFGNIGERAIEPGLAAVADLLRA
jgi:GntR family transcriptional regulator / MocR family aminotransferase